MRKNKSISMIGVYFCIQYKLHLKDDLLSVDLLCSNGQDELWRVNDMDIVRVFGNNLRKYRTKLGVSQEQFSEMCGMHRTYISAVECYRRSISLENIQRIADALGVEVYLLFIEDKE